MVIVTDPGSPPPNFDSDPSYNIPTSFCKKCQKNKPPRTFHCTICGRCILKQDHHCPWVLNCIGFYNHHYFALFLFYLWLGTFYTSLLSIPTILNWNFDMKTQALQEILALVTILFSWIFFFFLIPFGGWTYYLVLKGMSQIEYYNPKLVEKRLLMNNQSIFGSSARRNFQEFFMTDSQWWLFWLPTLRKPDWEDWLQQLGNDDKKSDDLIIEDQHGIIERRSNIEREDEIEEV